MKYFGFGKSLFILGALVGFSAAAHHSPTYFDAEVEVVHENVTVVDYALANPHGILVYLHADDGGDVVEWHAELPSANFLRRGGLTEATFTAGDTLAVVTSSPGVAGRTRQNLIRLTRVEFPNGDVATFTGISASFTRAEAD